MHVADVIQQIANTRKRNEKKELLRLIPKEYLEWAYSPHKRFYLTVPRITGIGTSTLGEFSHRLLKVLSDRSLSGKKAKQTVIPYILSLTSKDASVFQLILQKDFRCGIGVKTINEVFPNLIPESQCMLAEPFDENRVLYPCWADAKVDGIRADYDSGYLYSRSGKILKGYDHIIRAIKAHGIQIPLTGELRNPNVSFQKSGGSSRRTKSGSKKEEVFFVFDTPQSDVLASARFAQLQMIEWPKYVIYINKTLVHNPVHIGVLYEWCIKHGYEGLMVKSYNHLYTPGKSYDWMKLKPKDKVDLVVVDLEEGKGKWSGSLGKAIVMYKGNRVRVTPAIPDDKRKWYWDHPNEILDHSIEVIFQEETDGGKSLRHPRFKVVRQDK